MYFRGKSKFYRSRHGLIFGVCQGIADWKALPVGMVRIAVILIFLLTRGGFVLLVYAALAIFLPVDPGGSGGGDRPPDDSGSSGQDEPEWKKRFFDKSP
jgi:phage shock protein C